MSQKSEDYFKITFPKYEMASLYLSIISSGLKQFFALPISALVSALMPFVVKAPGSLEKHVKK